MLVSFAICKFQLLFLKYLVLISFNASKLVKEFVGLICLSSPTIIIFLARAKALIENTDVWELSSIINTSN